MSNVAHLPDQERWKLYQAAKRECAEKEAAGIAPTETYDQFIARVTREMGV